MKNSMIRRLALAFTIVALAGTGCAKDKKGDEGFSDSAGADENTLGDSDNGKASGLQSIGFPYDSFNLDGTAKGKLKKNAEIMKDKTSLKIQVEGHCDQRGGIQYNIALGEKRANSVKKYLVDLGVSGDRIATISYGKERLLDSRENEEAHAKNRRANFAVTAR